MFIYTACFLYTELHEECQATLQQHLFNGCFPRQTR